MSLMARSSVGPVAARVVPAFRPAQPLSVLAEHDVHHLQAGTDSQGQQALLRRFGDLGHRHDHLLRDGDLPRQRVRLGTATALLIGVAHGGPLPSSDDLAVARHLPLGRQRAGDRHSQVLRRPGHPLWAGCTPSRLSSDLHCQIWRPTGRSDRAPGCWTSRLITRKAARGGKIAPLSSRSVVAAIGSPKQNRFNGLRARPMTY